MWHGLFLSIERIGVVHRLLTSLPRFVRTAYVMLIVLIGWVFFRQESLDLAFQMLWRMFMPAATSARFRSWSDAISAAPCRWRGG